MHNEVYLSALVQEHEVNFGQIVARLLPQINSVRWWSSDSGCIAKSDPIELRVYGGRDGNFNLYEDEGVNYNYEKGAYATIPIQWSEGQKTLTVGPRQGTFPGMLDLWYW